MVTNQFGQTFLEADDLVTLLYSNPDLDINEYEISNAEEYNNAVKQLHLKVPQLRQPRLDTTKWVTQEQFDLAHQAEYFIPKEYEEIDVHVPAIIDEDTFDFTQIKIKNWEENERGNKN